MSIEELLRPRYKVTADYFYNPYKLCDVITVEYDDRSVHLTTTTYRNEFGETVEQANHFHPNRLKDFPHLFQPVQWWEQRAVEELRSIKYMKVVEYSGYHLVGDVVPVKKMAFSDDGFLLGYWLTGHLHPLHKIIPATAEEYTAFKSK